MLQQRCPMHVQPFGAAPRDRQILQDFRLQRSAQSPGLLDMVGLGSGLEFGKPGDAKVLVELHRFLGPESPGGKQFEHAVLDHLFAQRLQARDASRSDAAW